MNDIFESLERRIVAVTQRIAFTGVVIMLLLAFATTIDVLLRWLFNDPINGLNEVVAMGIAVAVASTFPAGAAQRVNLTIDLLHGKLSTRSLNWLKVAAAVLLLIFYVLLSWRIGVYASKLQERSATTIYLLMPTHPFVWLVSLFLAFTAIVQTFMVFATVRYALAGVDVPAGWSIGGADDGGTEKTPVQIAPGKVWAAGAAVLLCGALAVAAFYMGADRLGEFARNEPFTFSLILVALLWLLLILSVPLAAVMGLLGLSAAIFFTTLEPAMTVLGNETVGFLTNYEVAVLPMFLLMGSFAVAAGMSSDIYELAHKLLAHRRGGLALATVGGCAGFGALTGSSLATVATIGRVALPEMAARGYSTGLAAGSVAAGGTLGALVPPSIPLVFYALLTETSIGDLFVAAVIPATMAVLFYLTAIAIHVRVRPGAAPEALARSSFGEILAAVKKAWSALALLGVVVGAIYTGICTETEAAAIGAGGAFLVALARGRINRQTILQVM
ncbi:MAG: TRAP transporter large permease subunit, partial [Beijerinckiaceae bacterium]